MFCREKLQVFPDDASTVIIIIVDEQTESSFSASPADLNVLFDCFTNLLIY